MVSSCTPTPEPISYGSDICHFCKMTIVDQQHGAELVTQKGKVFKFDAIECMLNFEKENTDSDFALQLVNVYESPKELINAEESHYLISQALPSPMGAFLTAFENESAAKEFQSAKGGELFTWQSLQDRFGKEGFSNFSEINTNK
jgi:copper chaperone NosL